MFCFHNSYYFIIHYFFILYLGTQYRLFKRPPVEVYVALCLVETEVQVVDTCGVLHLGGERLVFLDAARLANDCCTDDVALLAVDLTIYVLRTGGSSGDGKLLGTFLAEVDTTQADILGVVEVVDVHILLSR